MASFRTVRFLSPPMGARLLDFTAMADRLVTPPRRRLDTGGPVRSDEPLENADEVYEQFPEQFHNTAHVLRTRRACPG
ncbi:hypothetical protein [Salinactinospora qingdaonensis]|uniref:Uncharacterized protein n=1 Tax=Salinactinospora qingdaonensis TaxID=702744 RepID=A0ABP7G5N7_9ACTN